MLTPGAGLALVLMTHGCAPATAPAAQTAPPETPSGVTPTTPAPPTALSEESVAHIKDVVAARAICRAAADARKAQWTGLWWTPDRSGPSVCLLKPGAASLAEPVREASSCSDDDINICPRLPLEMETHGGVALDVRELPDETSPVVGQLAPGSSATIYDRMYVRSFSHRGVVRAATGSFAAGQVVFPWREDEPVPWRPKPRTPEETSYTVLTPPMMDLHAVMIDGPPIIAWEELPRPTGPTRWMLVKTADGAKGWVDADGLQVDFEDPDGDE